MAIAITFFSTAIYRDHFEISKVGTTRTEIIKTAGNVFTFKVLVLANGAYGKRIFKICQTVGIDFDFSVSAENYPVPINLVVEKLESANANNVTYE